MPSIVLTVPQSIPQEQCKIRAQIKIKNKKKEEDKVRIVIQLPISKGTFSIYFAFNQVHLNANWYIADRIPQPFQLQTM